jgi:hypothetical protein
MKFLTVKEANVYLAEAGFNIGYWNRIYDIKTEDNFWVNYRPDKSQLLEFSYHAAAWLPGGIWKVFQIDFSTGWISPLQESLLLGLFYNKHAFPVNEENTTTFLFEFGQDDFSDQNEELIVSNLIFNFLLFESHGYLVSSGSTNGQILSIQDGVVVFISRNQSDINYANDLIHNFEQNPLYYPSWVTSINISRQHGNS